MIISQTPFRLSLFGGGSDFPLWYNHNDGYVVSMSINRFCYISVRNLPPFFNHKYRIVYSKVEKSNEILNIEHPAVRAILNKYLPKTPVEIQHQADLPARSGIGSSSAFVVGLLKAIFALKGIMIENSNLANIAIELEQLDMKENVGSQDQIACALGGLNSISFSTSGWQQNRIDISMQRKSQLQSQLFLLYSGKQRFSSDITQNLIGNLNSKDFYLKKMVNMAIESEKLLKSQNDLDQIGELLDESWHLKKQLNEFTSNDDIDDIYRVARKNGATGGKLMGAGGGGFFVFYVPFFSQDRFLQGMQDFIVSPIEISEFGTRIIFDSESI